MSFYKSIAEHYEEIFPLNLAQPEFVQVAFKGSGKLSLLDVGCGTGSLSIELDKIFKDVTAIDLDKAMLKKARAKDPGKIKWKVMDMLKIEIAFGQNSFDALVCFGNTLVHLSESDQILDFFKQAKAVLKNNGKFLFQIINYDRIIDRYIDGLPTLENKFVRFVRKYDYDSLTNSLDFRTKMLIKETGKEIDNIIKLYPIRKSEIDELLERAGYSSWQYFGNFNRDTLTGYSQPLICEALV